MKLLILATILSAHFISVLSMKLFFEPLGKLNDQNTDKSNHWALLVAGSKGWHNYRHQADICHAYQIMRKHGIPAEHIVTMMYDDIAYATKNKFPGVIINKPDGPNVYEGVVIDYRQKDVTPKNFLAILRGDAEAMKGIGSGKVIQSGPTDHVFVNFVDHGGDGILGFPSDLLYADDLINTIKDMHVNKKYGQMVLYIEACHSGSMFKDLPTDINVYATTASNARESSYTCYPDIKRNTFLGDEYSVSWMENSDEQQFNLATLHKQFLVVKDETEKSHVCEFGDKDISKETLDNFQGELGVVVDKPLKTNKNRNCFGHASENAPLALLYLQLDHSINDKEREEIKDQIKQLIWEMNFVEETSQKIVRQITKMTNHKFDDLYHAKSQVTNFECYKAAVKIYQEYCFDTHKNGYALKSLGKILNLCEANIHIDAISWAIKNTCTYAPREYDGHFYN